MLAEQLRKKHPRFIYEGVNFKYLENAVKIRFNFILEPDIFFSPETVIESDNWPENIPPAETMENLFFHIGLVEMMSYWKAACSPEIVIKAGFLGTDQIMWWEKLLIRGMGEFFFKNNIDFRSEEFLRISVSNSPGNISSRYEKKFPRDYNLIMVSGGKDSAVTLEILRANRENFRCMLLNPVPAAIEVAAKGGCQSPVIIRRTIDSRLLELNQAGYLNGHTPFSALLGFLGAACAIFFNTGRVITSNERSCEEYNIRYLDNKINHQYSKTFEFENEFNKYLHKYIARDMKYLSLLRPLYEIQISRLFSNYPQYFEIFRSCNRGLKTNSWCKNCPKCLSTFILLHPFLPEEDIFRIFGEDLFERSNVIPIIQQLIGINYHKPFECVGTREEIRAALYLSIEKNKRHQKILSPVLRYIKDEIIPKNPGIKQLAENILTDWGEDNNLPGKYAKLIREHLGIRNEIS